MKQLRTQLAAVLFFVSTWGLVSPVLADERTDARREFRQGMQMIADGQYDEGIKHLENAYEILPHPNVLYNIALAHTYAGRPDAAIYYFERYKETAPEADATEIDAIMARLRSQSAPETQVAEQEAPQSAEQARDELALVQNAAQELRRAAEASNSESLRKKADELEASAKRLRERSGTTVAATEEDKRSTSTTSPGVTTSESVETPITKPQIKPTQPADEAGVYEEQVVSASRMAQSPLDAPNATAIITAQDIRLTGLNNLNDLLRRVAGVEVNSISPNHAEVSIRGLNRRTSNKVMLLLDGRALRQEFLGSSWYDFLPISLEDVERIEIIRGPASALYGADAFSGIINIITKNPGEGGSQIAGGLGNHNQGRGIASFNGKEGDLAYHFGFGYDQEDNSRLTVAEDRVDVQNLTDSPHFASQKVWANAEMRYPIATKSQVTAGGNLVYGDQVVQGLSRLQQTSVDDAFESQVYANVTTPVGIRIGSWWNHMDASAGQTAFTPGQTEENPSGIQNIVDVDLSWSDTVKMGVPQTLTIGVGYRYKSIDFDWLDTTHQQHHFGAYIQDVIQLAKNLRLQLGARMDRHPLLNNVQFSPRGSLVYRFLEGQSLRATIGRAFRGPSFIESYLQFPNSTPLRGVSGWGNGRTNLDPESITSYEIGYQNQASDYFAFEANAYLNYVKNLILLTDVERFTLHDFATSPGKGFDDSAYDPAHQAYPVSSLYFTNERATYRQVGGELGVRFFPVAGLDLYTNYSIHDTRPDSYKGVDPVRAKEQQTSLHKVNGGIQYRAKFGLDTSLDVHWFSNQVWVEQVIDVERGVKFQAFNQPSFTMVNARIGYRFFGDRMELGVTGTNLAHITRRQHPYGQPLDTRIMGTAKVRF
jgi:iron complex outermembrane receptor protein